MRFLVIGGGGREHAICWKLAQSATVNTIYVAPGNAGTATEPKTTNVAISATDIPALVAFAQKEAIDCTIVGPEAPLALGVVDAFAAAHLRCFGVDAYTAQLERSKLFTKELLTKYNIPTPSYQAFTDFEDAKSYCEQATYPLVVKANGLAEGKGVTVAQSKQEALDALADIFIKRLFKEAGDIVLLEECVTGVEMSAIAIVSGTDYVPFVDVQDHKRLREKDTGPNTGGMGTLSPAPHMTDELRRKVWQQVIEPLLAAIAQEGMRYQGFLFVGLMIDAKGNPQVLEINCRLGDPETQTIMLRLESDLATLVTAAVDNQLNNVSVSWLDEHAVCVVLAAEGYPTDTQKGAPIPALLQPLSRDVVLFHAGTSYHDGMYHVAGGRVLAVCARHAQLAHARTQVYAAIQQLAWQGCQYRQDI